MSAVVWASLVDALRGHASARADARACLFLSDGDAVLDDLSFAAIDSRARSIAARLQGLDLGGECALLVYPPGPEFVGAFFGALYAGVIAVPLPVPRHRAGVEQCLALAQELDCRAVLTIARSHNRMARFIDESRAAPMFIHTEETPAELSAAWVEPVLDESSVAYLQYTSGSTSARKGVTIRHGNVLANLAGIAERFEHHEASVSVNWLPHFHDLGLVSGILQPLVHGHPNVQLSPTAFVQQPMRWLRAISVYRGTYTNSPNYGYDLCVRRADEAALAELDLSSLEVALNGAEPVRAETLEAFNARFAACGLRAQALYPAYGLAEATLVVSGGRKEAGAMTLDVDAAALESDRIIEALEPASARRLVGCGQALQDTRIAIVDPDSFAPLEARKVGEIWVNGPGVADGFWHHESASRESFRAEISESPGTSWLRTGDLGFLDEGELYVTGRIKDLIIVRGSNHYPQDIEWTIEQCHDAFRPGCGAVFAWERDGQTCIVAAFEVEREHLRDVDATTLGRLARQAVAEAHELRLDTLVLLRTGTVPRTSSGKIQRNQCRSDFLTDSLKVVGRDDGQIGQRREEPHEYGPAPGPEPLTASGPHAASPGAGGSDALIDWLREYSRDRLDSMLMDERRSLTPSVILDFGNRGVLGLQAPPDVGGLGLGEADALRVIEQLGAIDLTLAMMTIVHNTLGLRPILRAAQNEVRDDWAPRLARGRDLVAFAITERGAGSNPQAISAYASPAGRDAWRLYGEKLWSGTAGWASVINVFVQNRDEQGQTRGLSGFVVPRDRSGLRVGEEALTLGMRAMVQNAVHLEGAIAGRKETLGVPGEGMAVAQDAMMQGRLHIAAACLGGLKRSHQLLTRYAMRRDISTGPLLDNPVTLSVLSDIACDALAVEALVGTIALSLDRGDAVPVEAYAVCKTAAPEALWRAADALVQGLGGRGYMENNIAARLLRDARVARILEGPTEALMMFLGSRVANEGRATKRWLLELGAEGLYESLTATTGEVLAQAEQGTGRFADGVAARRWAYVLIGELTTQAVLLACSRAMAVDAKPVAVLQARFDAACNRLRHELQGPGLSRSELLLSAERFESSIGLVEQLGAGETRELDDMLASPPVATRAGPPADPGNDDDAGARRSGPDPETQGTSTAAPGADSTGEPSTESLARFISQWIEAELKLPPRTVKTGESMLDHGIDSVTAVLLSVSLEEHLGREVYPDVVYDFPVVRALAAFLAGENG